MKARGFLGKMKIRGRSKQESQDRGISESEKRQAIKEEVRLRDGKEGAQGGLSLSYFHFSVQP